ncbi:MAG: hypothetical protein GTO63_09560 [Anaerolineae bacterium]|nr:hypothetical protein [Anaerolineae bacterium]NIN95131.1 hypothetical protein [Anaerolineae bacterium]NIQ78983.1 hypothetical protein [Anaerolineae bacterium]
MKTIAPLQLMNLGKSFVIFFIVTSLAWIGANYVIFRDFLIGWPILIGNVIIAGAVGWWWYRRNYHAILSYDGRSFELQRGKARKKSKNWRDFSRVSLVHEGYGRFLVRLYEDDKEHTDIPASDLKLDASDFRFEVMELVGVGEWLTH